MAGRLSDIRAQVDPLLTRFATGFMPLDNMIAHRIAPEIPTAVETGTFYTLGKEGLQIYNSQRALRADPKRIDWKPGKDTYLCKEHTLGTEYDHQELDEARAIGGDVVLRMEQKAVQLTQMPLDLEFEKEVADSVFAAANYATGNKLTLSGNDQWKASGGSQGSTSDPIGNIEDGIDAARDDMGRRPNTIVFGYDAWKAFKHHQDILDRIKYSERGVITPEIVASIFDFRPENVLIGEPVYSADGSTFTNLWTDNVGLLYVPQGNELVEGSTPHTVVFRQEGFPKVLTYQDAYRKYYDTQKKWQVKNINTSYGYLLVDVNGAA